MIRRPESHGVEFAARFQHQSVVDRYHLRPTYPPETFELLSALLVDEPRVVLDVGCGTGNIARPLADYVDRIDAVDWSLPMIDRAKLLPGGNSPKIRWLHGRVEEIETEPPYSLITAGESLHWMDWGVVLPHFAREISACGVLATVYIAEEPNPWSDGYVELVKRFSTNPTYVPFDWIAELERCHLFNKIGERKTAPVLMRQSIDDYVAAQHARSALSLDTMTVDVASQFDTQLQSLVTQYAQDGWLTLSIVGGLTWGKPLTGNGAFTG